jgi:hypothetical protein
MPPAVSVPAELEGAQLANFEHAHFEVGRAGAMHVQLVLIRLQHTGVEIIQQIPAARFEPLRAWLMEHWAGGRVSHGPARLNWVNLMRSDAIQDNRFYESTDENGEPKPAGWAWLMDDDNEE